MPFVLRNSKGEVTGTFTVRHHEGEQFLDDDNPEIVAYNARTLSSLPKDFLRPLTEAERKLSAAEHEVHQREHATLNNAVLAVYRGWSELELALSGLVYEVLHLPNKGSRLPNVIYFSPTSLDARTTLVSHVVLQLIEEDEKGLGDLRALWAKVSKKMKTARETRNAVAHGAPVLLHIRGKKYVRWTSPSFDHIRVGRHINKGEIPGVSADELSQSVKLLHHLMECVDDVNRVVVAYRDTPSAFQEKLLVLRERLQA